MIDTENRFVKSQASKVPPDPGSLWWIEVGGVKEGPITWSVIQELLHAGALSADDSIMPNCLASWCKVKDLPELVSSSEGAVRELVSATEIRENRESRRPGERRLAEGRLDWITVAVGIWIGLALAWISMTLLDWPFIWDGALTARLTVFGAFAIVAASVFILPRFWENGKYKLTWQTQVLRVLCAVVAFMVITLFLTLAINARELMRVAIGADEFRGGSVSAISARVVEVRGPLSAGIAGRLKDQLALQPETKTILLNSEGGWIREGDRIGRLVSQLGLDTHSSTECASACAAAFVHGRRRTLSQEAVLGFHSASGKGTDPIYVQLTNDWLAERLAEIGVSKVFLERAFSTPSSEMWYPPHHELILEGIIHDVTL